MKEGHSSLHYEGWFNLIAHEQPFDLEVYTTKVISP